MITIDGKEYRNLEEQVQYLTDKVESAPTSIDIPDGSITSDKIADNAVTKDKIPKYSITWDRLNQTPLNKETADTLYVQKTAEAANVVYAHKNDGTEITIPYKVGGYTANSSIIVTDSTGYYNCKDPTQTTHTANKRYVDNTASKLRNEAATFLKMEKKPSYDGTVVSGQKVVFSIDYVEFELIDYDDVADMYPADLVYIYVQDADVVYQGSATRSPDGSRLYYVWTADRMFDMSEVYWYFEAYNGNESSAAGDQQNPYVAVTNGTVTMEDYNPYSLPEQLRPFVCTKAEYNALEARVRALENA